MTYAVVHVVVDGINISSRAGIGSSGATASRAGLVKEELSIHVNIAERNEAYFGSGVRDLVTFTVASTLEGVVQADPVTSLVSQSTSLVVVLCTARQGSRMTARSSIKTNGLSLREQRRTA